jgi:hypothetical protein
MEAQMFITWITPPDGIARRHALVSVDRTDAVAEAQQLGAALFGAGFTYCVRAE